MKTNVNIANTQRYMELVRDIVHQQKVSQNRELYCYSHSYGCQQNVSDGERIDGLLTEMGYRPCETPDQADFILYNTCAVREGAEDRVFGNIGTLKHLKKHNPGLVIAVCGCMTQQKHIIERIRTSFPYVDLVFGAGAMHQLPELLYHKLTDGGRLFDVLDPTFDIVEDLPVHREEGAKAWLPIMYGCNNFCSYCIVPYTRGRERSRDPERILAEAKALVAEGYREITLLGQNVNSYGKGLDQEINFSGLLREICQIPGDFRLRFMTSHPKDCTRELIDTIAEEEKICSHLHLPVQSGSNQILKAMNRHYTVEDYLSLIEYAKERVPGITFTSDIIIGFPGEREEDVAQTLQLVEQVGYQSLFTFQYSPRQGTKAFDMEDPVTREEKTSRFEALLTLQSRMTRNLYNSMVGKTYRVLVEGSARSGESGWMTGRNESNIIFDFMGSPELTGEFVSVTVVQPANWAVIGEIAAVCDAAVS